MNRFVKSILRALLILICIIVVLTVGAYLYVKRTQFGALPEDKRLELVKRSPHYSGGRFRNLTEKPTITEGFSIWREVWNSIVKTYPHTEPAEPLPSVKTDLKAIPADRNVLVWFGHSSFFLQVDGVKILVDPVFSGMASPLPWGVKAYDGSDIFTADDMPEIDYMLLSHDHYDHLDYQTAKALQTKVKHVICGFGAGAHYERWGYTAQQILEKDWGDTVTVKPGFNIFTENTHHGSGRGFESDKSQWLSFFIQSPVMNIYYSGDGGYSDRFKNIAKKYPVIDWAIMECGQYNKAWESVHQLPEQVAQATVELGAKNLLPVHHSKFTLARHRWDEPLEQITALSKLKPYRLATPMIGEMVRLDDKTQIFTSWWKNIK